jgi:ribose transport system permease protein
MTAGMSARNVNLIRRLRDYAVLIVLLAICAYLTIATDTFATIRNLANVSEQISVVGIVAMGMTMLLISANLDLSVGGQVALIGVIIARVMNAVGIWPALVAAVIVGFGLGLVNGLIVTRLKVNSLVATLGSGLAFGGIAFLVSGSQPIVLADRALRTFMSGHFAGVPVPTWIFLAAIAFSAWFLHFTVGGRELFAVGANAEAARYAGIRVNRVSLIPFVLTGVLCAFAAMILTALLNTASPNAGAQLPLQVIAAVVVGGVSIAGGRGTIFMAVVGVLLIGVVANGFNLLTIDPTYQSIFTGVIIVIAVAIDSAMRALGARASAPREPAVAENASEVPVDSRPHRNIPRPKA